MIKKLLPKKTGSHYNGHPLARWALIPITFVTIARSLVHILAPDGGAQSIATIPINEFTPNGAASVIHIFALWGLSQLIIGLIYLAVLWRWHSLIPLMYMMLVLEYSGRLLIALFKPFHITGTAPGAVANYFMIPIGLILFLLSLSK